MTAQLGLGTYLQSEDDLREVLARAHHFGFDLVDTSTNYGHGVSQRVVGQYLRQARTWMPKVVTKVGYVTEAMIANQNIPASVTYPTLVTTFGIQVLACRRYCPTTRWLTP